LTGVADLFVSRHRSSDVAHRWALCALLPGRRREQPPAPAQNAGTT